MVHCPKALQPSHAKWTDVTEMDPTSDDHRSLQRMLEGPAIDDSSAQASPCTEKFPSVAPVLARNFMITDVYYQSPSRPSLGYPGPDEEVWDIDPPGLAHIPNEVLAELPQECLRSFQDAVQEEKEWKETWKGEAMDGNRAPLHITYNNVS